MKSLESILVPLLVMDKYLCLPNFYLEVLAPDVMVLGDGHFEEHLCLDEVIRDSS